MAQVTISSVTLSGWSGLTTGVALYVFCDDAFTGSDGAIVPKSVRENVKNGLGAFYQSLGCTVNQGQLVIPSVTLESTTDSLDNSSATYSAVLWDQNSNQMIQQFGTFPSFPVSPAPVATTWAAIFSSEADL
jgi:hypothetical protein